MAYKISSGKLFVSKAGVMAEIDTLMIDAGWTRVEHNATNVPPSPLAFTDGSYVVYSSNGELGDRIAENIRFYYGCSGWILLRPVLYWTPGTPAEPFAATVPGTGHGYWNKGVESNPADCNDVKNHHFAIAVNDFATNMMYAWASKDLVMLAVRPASTWTNVIFGHFPKKFWKTVGTVTGGPYTGGSGYTMTLSGITGAFKPNCYYQIVGASYASGSPDTGGRERVLVTGVGAGTIDVFHLNNTYTSGSLIGECPSTFGCVDYPASNGWMPTCSVNSSGVANAADRYTFNSVVWNDNSAFDPIGSTAFGYPLAVNGTGSASTVGYYNDANLFWTGSASPYTVANEDTFEVGRLDFGSALGTHNTNQMEDTTKAWTVNEFADQVLIMTSGQSVGQTRKIVSNTATVVVVTPDWVNIPADNDQYVIATEAYRFIANVIAKEGV